MKTGAELKARREELKITQQDLADEIGVSRTQLSRMESGKIEIPIEIRPVLYDSLYTKHEQPKLKFSDLEVGDYVYVRDDLINSKYYGNNTYDSRIGKGLLKITELNKFMYVNNCIYDVTPEMLDLSRSMKKEDYLKMNEKEDVSFDDLIDAAVQAKKDGVCEGVEIDINNWLIVKSAIGNIHCHKNHLISDNEFHINWIKSLYTEEFVIKTMADELKIKSGAELTLSNGINCVYFDDSDRKLRYDDDFYPCNFLVLKGATVKQSKGVK